MGMVFVILGIGLLLIVLFLLHFYRDPKRKIPSGENLVSPADGKIIRIIKTDSKKIKIRKGLMGKVYALTKDVAKECYVISIFMSPLNVHINRAPVAGKIISTKHEKGKFFAAYDLKKSLMNEKNEILMENKQIGKIKMLQIAGFLARRIICSVKKNEKVNKGSKIGKIVLGSQLTIIIPSKNINLKIKQGQKVYAGKSMIADILK
ncbi:phosphatidylserine decarboxylase [Candidatus Woesearchaeota archaeon]|nr:phosphatidylserine decarboxylase [Candidatus Woesearchaeota archaeon]